MAFLDNKTGDLPVYWKTKTAITDLVGTGNNARIYAGKAKQGVALPYITYEVSNVESHVHHQGITSLRTTTLDVFCYAATDAAAWSLAEAVKIQTETIAVATLTGTQVQNVRVLLMESGLDVPQDASDAAKYFVRIVFDFLHSQATS